MRHNKLKDKSLMTGLAATMCMAIIVSCTTVFSAEQSKFKDICTEIQNKYENKTLKNITIDTGDAYSANKHFFIDIDNDGKEEELKYVTAGARAAIYTLEIAEGKRTGLPGVSAGYATQKYTGVGFIRYGEKILAMHTADGRPFELQEWNELSPNERAERENSKNKYYDMGERRYGVKVLCQYYTLTK